MVFRKKSDVSYLIVKTQCVAGLSNYLNLKADGLPASLSFDYCCRLFLKTEAIYLYRISVVVVDIIFDCETKWRSFFKFVVNLGNHISW